MASTEVTEVIEFIEFIEFIGFIELRWGWFEKLSFTRPTLEIMFWVYFHTQFE